MAGQPLLWNRIAAEDDAGFNARYEETHPAEGPSVSDPRPTGSRTAERA